MRRIGTVSSAVGLVFLGVWLILAGNDISLANQVFHWWPVVIIIMGIEIIVFYHKNAEGKPRFNFFVVGVVAIFVIINIVHALTPLKKIPWERETWSYFDLMTNNYKKIPVGKTIPVNNNTIALLVKDARINIKESPDNTVKLEGEVWVDKDSPLTAWNINELQDMNGTTVNLNNGEIKRVSVDFYIPYGCTVRLEADTLKTRWYSGNMDKLMVNCQQGNLELANIRELQAKLNDGKIDYTGHSDSIILAMQSGKVDIDGDVNMLDLKLNNGKVGINNKFENKATIVLDNGVVDYCTQNRDASVNLSVGIGVTRLNKQKTNVGQITQTFGAGSSKINIRVGNGAVSFQNQE